ncbi:MAG: biotin/lipoyl-binding protein [Armatimonadetes bacterium]|nr:biotin/lipoyl-binding protein [Armatimonadota bacterium]
MTHVVDLDLVRSFCDIVETHDLAALEVSYKEFRVKVSRAHEAPPAVVASVPAGVAQSPVEPSRPAEPANVVKVRSPLAGVFYSAVRPGAAPFVEEGSEVHAGQTLCIIEAMKLMNEIAAEVPGRVYRILVENGHVVEAGQDIIWLVPAGA